jgi:hypothetical protein
MLSNVALSHVNQFGFFNSFLIRTFNTLIVSDDLLKGENDATLFKSISAFGRDSLAKVSCESMLSAGKKVMKNSVGT